MFQSVSMFRCSPSQLSAPPLVVLLGLEVVTRVAVILGLILLIILSTLNTSVCTNSSSSSRSCCSSTRSTNTVAALVRKQWSWWNCTVAVTSSCSLLLVLWYKSNIQNLTYKTLKHSRQNWLQVFENKSTHSGAELSLFVKWNLLSVDKSAIRCYQSVPLKCREV